MTESSDILRICQNDIIDGTEVGDRERGQKLKATYKKTPETSDFFCNQDKGNKWTEAHKHSQTLNHG